MAQLSSLPPEIVREILTYVGAPTLLAFGQTCKFNRAVSLISPSSLCLSVFPTKINSIASLLARAEDDEQSSDNRRREVSHRLDEETIHVVLGKEKSRGKDKDMIIDHQNAVVRRGVKTMAAANLQSLEIAVWDLQRSTAAAIAQLKRLRYLSVRLDHPTTRHRSVDPAFWSTSPGSTSWNEFYSRQKSNAASSSAAVDATAATDGKKAKTVFGRLRCLRLERSGITDYQLLRIIEENPDLEVLVLRKCLTLSEEFFEMLAESPAAKNLKVLAFTHSDHEDIDARILKHIDRLTALESLSFHACLRITDEDIHACRGKWGISHLVLPGQAEDDVLERFYLKS